MPPPPRTTLATDLWIATRNPQKRLELERLLAPLGYRIRGIDEAPFPVHFVEDRDTFAGNAAVKAQALARAVEAFALGDDSGLCVAALDGRPGVHSARYAGEGRSDADRIAKLLGELEATPGADRRAWFTCSICLAGPDGAVLASFEEHCRGFIRETPTGRGGFGYDPIFVPEELAAERPPPSFAELDPERKDAISHRGRALRRLRAFLAKHHPQSTTP